VWQEWAVITTNGIENERFYLVNAAQLGMVLIHAVCYRQVILRASQTHATGCSASRTSACAAAHKLVLYHSISGDISRGRKA
jgi:hypothetical protein